MFYMTIKVGQHFKTKTPYFIVFRNKKLYYNYKRLTIQWKPGFLTELT